MTNQIYDTSKVEHSLTEDFPNLAKEWHELKNGTPASLVSKWDHKKETWWECTTCSFQWTAPLWRRKQGAYKCPICFGKRIVPGLNDFLTRFPSYEELWDFEKNIADPRSIGTTSKEFWFSSKECGHSWKMAPSRVAQGAGGCRICSSRLIIPGLNDLATKLPEIAKTWSAKNDKLASQVPASSSKKYLWEDRCGHEWEMTISNRLVQNCPYCSGKRVIPGVNDLESRYPDYAKEWHPKNTLKASEVFPNSSTIYWWICSTCANEWEASPNSRHPGKREKRCPKCPKKTGTSKKEIAVGDLIASWGYKVERNKKVQRKKVRKELDIYLPDLQLGIEFNGSYWHRPIFNEDNDNVTKYRHFLKWSFFTVFHKTKTVFVWESDWDIRRDEVEDALRRFLKNPDDVDTMLMKWEEFPND